MNPNLHTASEWACLAQDEAGWPKRMSTEDEVAYVAELPAEERHCVVGLGGSQVRVSAVPVPCSRLSTCIYKLKRPDCWR
jgi:hypothetical protein